MARRITSGGPRSGSQRRTRSITGHFYVRKTMSGEVIQGWPKKRRNWKNPTNLEQRADFAAMVAGVKDMPADHVEFAYAAAKGSGYAPRDILSLLYRGRWVEILRPDEMPIQADLDQISTETGAMVVRHENGWFAVLPGEPDQVLAMPTDGDPVPFWTDLPPPPGVTPSLFDGVMSIRPTQSNTGLSTWLNQGAAVATDSAAGLNVKSTNTTQFRSLRKAVPTAPYTIRALVALNSTQAAFAGALFGWTDLTKYHVWLIQSTTGILVTKFSGPGTFVANDLVINDSGIQVPRLWLEIKDDGTNVVFSMSADGDQFIPRFTVSKASGYLGSTGYTNIVFGASCSGVAANATLLSYSQTQP